MKDHVDDNGELRVRALGRLRNQAVLGIIHVNRNEDGEEIIRIISARKAGPDDRRRYYTTAIRRRIEESR